MSLTIKLDLIAIKRYNLEKMSKEKTEQHYPIVAVGTPLGRGAVAIVRMSGKGCIDIARKMFAPFPVKSNELKHGRLSAEGVKDDIMCVYFNSPKSYTGEDMVEFHTHGGFFIAQSVAEACIALGCRAAENGEFTKRAFLNGKLNLNNAEAIIDMIEGESKRAVNNAYNVLTGRLNEKLIAIQNKLVDMIAAVEAALDYPEEELEVPAKEQVKKQAQEILEETEKLLATAKTGRLVKNGIDVVIAGETNVGKSSLLNCLLGFERAIVTDIAGTTRDTLSQSVVYRDVKFNFIDTAGIRETSDAVEKIGVQRAEQALKNADIILFVLDVNRGLDCFANARKDTEKFQRASVLARREETKQPKERKETGASEKLLKDHRTIAVFNKTDLATAFKKPFDGEMISALTGVGLEQLKETIYKKTQIEKISADDVVITNNRHADCLKRATEGLRRAAKSKEITMDCVAAELTDALSALGEVTGANATEDVVNRIFEKFCLGK